MTKTYNVRKFDESDAVEVSALIIKTLRETNINDYSTEYIEKRIGRKIIETLEKDEFYLRAKRIEVPASITACEFY